MKKITKRAQVQFIREKLATDSSWALRGLQVVFDHQTNDEQSTNKTKHSNRLGFNRSDAKILSPLAKTQLSGLALTADEMTVVFAEMPKYAWQIRHRTANFDEEKLIAEMTK
jgi:hypothetical protein